MERFPERFRFQLTKEEMAVEALNSSFICFYCELVERINKG